MVWLARREYARVELERRLAQADYDRDEIEAALDGLAEDGLQSDDRFTEAFIRQRASRAYGPRRIRAELRQRGVEASRVDLHLLNFEGNWFDVAEQAWRRRYGDAPIESFEDKARRYRHMGQRGFDHEQTDHAAAACAPDDEQ